VSANTNCPVNNLLTFQTRWADLVAEARALRKEVSQIARDYDEKGKLADADPGSDKIEEREQVKKEELS